MTISKEERAELRDLIHEVSKGDHNFPVWDYDDSSPFEHPEIIEHSAVDGVQHIGNLPSKWHTRFACAAVNALPKLLASLDAADERIAGLEADVALLRAENDICLCGAIFECESLRRFIATISYVAHFGGTRRVKKAHQRLEREWFFAAFRKEVTK